MTGVNKAFGGAEDRKIRLTHMVFRAIFIKVRTWDLSVSCTASGCGSVWLERFLREEEAASSNLVTPSKD